LFPWMLKKRGGTEDAGEKKVTKKIQRGVPGGRWKKRPGMSDSLNELQKNGQSK